MTKKATTTDSSIYEADSCHISPTVRDELQEKLLGHPAEQLAGWFKGLSDSNRVKICYVLTQHKELCVHDIAAILSISIANASHHLRLMRLLGITKTRKDKTTVFYSLADEHVRSILLLGMDHIEEAGQHNI
ncbi:metalloregulator ArsR/SmtB family transcription factor [Aneurinibacillus sp. Ricciae_BoGa-3]|uniref:ArsR/SmtB family transcription factor n=1 Tax=Aneurinibacillus sp. Ricciae_BoGa-3 TaxID=3022697 RepID=UPI00233FE2F3|nr:metalloregulator ArsR/SmtB family transcription factor [Aneurinibacillus sp. Ricciae_BoGa-3]WCK55305.1 metalloregulator ArsR/SmtB family transcription factor [Aneurinibacillus sp. Ricciae_BoGa-3]